MEVDQGRWERMVKVFEAATVVLNKCFIEEKSGEYIEQYFRFGQDVIGPLWNMRGAINDLREYKNEQFRRAYYD